MANFHLSVGGLGFFWGGFISHPNSCVIQGKLRVLNMVGVGWTSIISAANIVSLVMGGSHFPMCWFNSSTVADTKKGFTWFHPNRSKHKSTEMKHSNIQT